MVDGITGRGRRYHHGEIYQCTYEECKDLEITAVWHTSNMIDMLMGDDKWDRSMGRPQNISNEEAQRISDELNRKMGYNVKNEQYSKYNRFK